MHCMHIYIYIYICIFMYIYIYIYIIMELGPENLTKGGLSGPNSITALHVNKKLRVHLNTSSKTQSNPHRNPIDLGGS